MLGWQAQLGFCTSRILPHPRSMSPLHFCLFLRRCFLPNGKLSPKTGGCLFVLLTKDDRQGRPAQKAAPKAQDGGGFYSVGR